MTTENEIVNVNEEETSSTMEEVKAELAAEDRANGILCRVKFPVSFYPEKATGEKQQAYEFELIQIKQGFAYVTNGKYYIKKKLDMENVNTETIYIHGETLKGMRKFIKRRCNNPEIVFTKNEVTLFINGEKIIVYPAIPLPEDIKFPDIDKYIPVYTEDESVKLGMSINGLENINAAMAGEGGNVCFVVPCKEGYIGEGPTLIRPFRCDFVPEEGDSIGIMPVRFDDSMRAYPLPETKTEKACKEFLKWILTNSLNDEITKADICAKAGILFGDCFPGEEVKTEEVKK